MINLKRSDFQRAIPIPQIDFLTKKRKEKKLKFGVHIDGEYDYKIVCERRDELFLLVR